MPSLSQSPLLQALGYAIANSLWQMAMVWIVYVLLNSLFKFRSETKYRIAVAAQVTGFAWFLVTLQFYYQQCSQALRIAEALYLENGEQATYVLASSDNASLLSIFIKAEQVLPYLSVAYLLLLAFLVIRWLKAYKYTQIVRLNGLHKIDVDWKLFVTRVAGQLGIKQKVRIYLSELVNSPVTIGFLKPVILVPVASFTHLTPQQLEAVILHELAHIKRHDYVLNIVLSIIELGLFFNPFTRLINKSISKERENSCDDWVLQYQYNPSMYAEALLRIAVLQKSSSMAMYAVKSKGELLSRVQRMVHQKDSRFNYRHQLLALLLMTGILTSIAWFDPSSLKAQDTRSGTETQAVVLEPLAVKIDNPLFNPMFFLNKPLKEEVKQTVAENRKQEQRVLKPFTTATREINLPTVMAPVAIENLIELEKNLVRLSKDVKRTTVTSMAPYLNNMRVAHNQVFKMDSARFGTLFHPQNQWTEGNWLNLTEELKASQKSLEDAMKLGKITVVDARKMQAEIIEAYKHLKDVNIPQVFTFAPSDAFVSDYFYREAFTEFESEKERSRAKAVEAGKKEKVKEVKAGVKGRRPVVDTIRQRLLERTTLATAKTGHPQGTANGYIRIMEGKTPPVLIDQMPTQTAPPKTNGASGKPATPVKPGTYYHGNTAVQGTATYYSYTQTENGDECEKANRAERKKACPVNCKHTNCKTTKTTKVVQNGKCYRVVVPAKKEAEEPIIIDIQFE